ncbi:hypothetical protein BOMU111920_14530 [Bordetella muralis]
MVNNDLIDNTLKAYKELNTLKQRIIPLDSIPA